ncbi:DUF29 domain-containing protein [Nguyenibacter vanlangensis]|uniref:DUF29 domain-containing protein n=1 Tax=Nguyenibacter vanlangensis TaxID=1216886 RepID=A0A7Y7M5K4_9PROT|nr:DUF29 domain-containing protein [Nguyenibacter vanlangensis]NVN09701.1 DUF29 domain-containing protein [Nguyenibacter vanlangensis]
MTVSYDQDIVAWAAEQARLIRAGQFDKLDIEHIADEIEDVGKGEQRELASRMAMLVTHLLKWLYQPAFRSASWSGSIREQRRRIRLALKRTPSLKASLIDPDWLEEAWSEGLTKAITETGLDAFPEAPIWTADQMLTEGWLPGGAED